LFIGPTLKERPKIRQKTKEANLKEEIRKENDEEKSPK